MKCLSIFSFVLLICTSFLSCTDTKSYVSVVEQWNDREIKFPTSPTYTIRGKDTINFLSASEYKILSYVDSIGCISCKLQLSQWKTLMNVVDSANLSVDFLFFFSPEKEKDVYRAINMADFGYPICIDMNDSLNKLNHFPSEMAFQTFLLDKSNKVLAIGNPVHNPKVKELYLKIIKGDAIGQENESEQIVTKADVDKSFIQMGSFDWQEGQKATFTLKNTGNKVLVIQDIVTSCGCTTVSYSKEPVQPGKEVTLEVAYKAEHPGYFDKTVTVYCNAEDSPLKLRINGNAQ